MPSNSLLRWREARAAALDEIEDAHAQVGGVERGRRYATQQINRAYAVLLASEFQGFCRNLHSECAERIIAATPADLQEVIRQQFLWGRQLDRGNAQSAAIGSDSAASVSRFGKRFTPFTRCTGGAGSCSMNC
jgi:hypothetical protein